MKEQIKQIGEVYSILNHIDTEIKEAKTILNNLYDFLNFKGE